MRTRKIILLIFILLLVIFSTGHSTAYAASIVEAVIGAVPGLGFDFVQNFVANMINGVFRALAAFILYLAGLIFDFSIYLSITELGNLLQMDAFKIGWTISRDIVNIIFIFILLYIAIGTILKLFSAKKMLVSVIIIALLVNFSGVLTKVVIDASNVLAKEFYNRISPGEGALGKLGLNSIGARFFTELGLQGLAKNPDQTDIAGIEADTKGRNPVQIITAGFLSAILMIITAFVLLAGAFFFIARAIIFLVLYMISPFALATLAIPGSGNVFKRWWQKLLDQAIFAPVFLFFIAITLVIIENNSLDTLASKVEEGAILASTFRTIILFVMLDGLIIAGLIVSKSLGAVGADKAIGWGKFLAGGTTGYVGSRTIGRAAKNLSESSLVQNLKASEGRTFLGLGGIKRLTGRTLGVASANVAGFGFGSGQGYTKRIEEKGEEGAKFSKSDLKRRADYIHNSLNADEQKVAYEKLSARDKVALENAASGESLQTIKKLKNRLSVEERERVRKEHAEFAKTKSHEPLVLAKHMSTLEDSTEDQRAIYEKLPAPERLVLQETIEKASQDMTLSEPERQIYRELKTTIEALRNSLSAEERIKTEKAAAEKKDYERSSKVKEDLKIELNKTTPQEIVIKGLVKQLKGKEIEKLDPDSLVKIAKHIEVPQLQILAKSTELDQETRNKIREEIERAATSPTTSPTPEQTKAANWLNSQAGDVF